MSAIANAFQMIVGERGPEIVTLPRGGFLTPNDFRATLGFPPIEVTSIIDKERVYHVPDLGRVHEHCQYCRRARTNLRDNCLSCGAPPS